VDDEEGVELRCMAGVFVGPCERKEEHVCNNDGGSYAQCPNPAEQMEAAMIGGAMYPLTLCSAHAELFNLVGIRPFGASQDQLTE
jgi:hypothetical protein